MHLNTTDKHCQRQLALYSVVYYVREGVTSFSIYNIFVGGYLVFTPFYRNEIHVIMDL